ncbi:MAG: AAA ATPase central protein, partial [uncultured bacterium]
MTKSTLFESRPLAQILRPSTLRDVIGQTHLVGSEGMLTKMLASQFVPSMIFWGPPGCGKTTLAELVSTLTKSVFISKSAVTTNLADVRQAIDLALKRLTETQTRTVLFIDEIHRFNKAQQDALLPHVEKGTIIFIGATTENPSFEVISPLLSRCRVLVLSALSEDELKEILTRGLHYVKKTVTKEAEVALLLFSNGDARQLLTILEIASSVTKKKELDKRDIEEAAQKKMLQYDRVGDEHYNTISAFIKSMR